jgi:hypothetical protein
MNYLNRIFHAAIALQGVRTPAHEVYGIDKTPQGDEFAKALAEGIVFGLTPGEVVEQVTKAMCGNEQLALDLMIATEEITKAHVEAHTRTLASGKVTNVHAYENARARSMTSTSHAQGATLHAQRLNTPEAHENAASAHEEARKMHAEAHEMHPADAPETGRDHATLREQHAQQAQHHKEEAQKLRNASAASGKSSAANTASNLASQAGTGAAAADRHRSASRMHEEAAKMAPGQGHEDKAESHEALAEAHEAFDKSMDSPHKHKARYEAMDASGKALKASMQAHVTNTHEDHQKAADAHEKALTQHLDIHGEKETDEDAHHGQIFKHHEAAWKFHSQRAKNLRGEAELAAAPEPVAKADGPMTSTPTTTDLAKKEGGEALAVEGRPKEDEEVAKAHVEQHTREVGGKVVQVSSYDTHYNAAGKASSTAHAATAKAQNPEAHAAAAATHMKAAAAHREAAKYAPESWQEKGHEQNAQLHEHYAQAHHAKAKAAGNRSDTGVDQPPHTPQDIQNLEQHSDYQGYGYVGHDKRTPETDKAVAEAANKSGLSHHELAAHLLGKSGRHMMDAATSVDPKAHTAHFQRWMTDPKHKKEYDIQGYAQELEEKSKGPVGAAEHASTQAAQYDWDSASKPLPPEDLQKARDLHKKAAGAHMEAADHPGADRKHHSSMADMHFQDARKIQEMLDTTPAKLPEKKSLQGYTSKYKPGETIPAKGIGNLKAGVQAKPGMGKGSALPENPSEAHDHAEEVSYNAWNSGGPAEHTHEAAIKALQHSVKKSKEAKKKAELEKPGAPDPDVIEGADDVITRHSAKIKEHQKAMGK